MFWSRARVARELVRVLREIDPDSVTTWSSPISDVHVVVVGPEHAARAARAVANAGGFRVSTRVDGVWHHSDERVIVRIAVPSNAVALTAARQADRMHALAAQAGALCVRDWIAGLLLPERDELTNMVVTQAQRCVTEGPFGSQLPCTAGEPYTTLGVLLTDLVAPPQVTTSPALLAATMARALVTDPTLVDVASALAAGSRYTSPDELDDASR